MTNTKANIRAICGMPTTTPSDDTLTAWQSLIQGVIDEKFPGATLGATNMVEMNLIHRMWNNRDTTPNKKNSLPEIPAFSDNDKWLLGGSKASDSGVDGIPMNGKRQSEIYY